MAAVWKVPAVIIVENNLYGEYTPLRETTPIDDLAERAASYAMRGMIVDGQDVSAVQSAVNKAVERARSGDGPTLLEVKTYRFQGHSRTDPGNYRAPGELDRWKQRDPLLVLNKSLVASGLLDDATDRAIKRDVQARVDSAAARAQEARYPTLEEIQAYVYSV